MHDEHREGTVWTRCLFALAQHATALVEYSSSGHSGGIGTDEVSSTDDWPKDILLPLRPLAVPVPETSPNRAPGLDVLGVL